MNTVKVTSSHIESVGHDPRTETLRITYKTGDAYDYQPVPAEVYGAILAAESVGQIVNKVIKPNYEGKKVEPPTKAITHNGG